MRTVVLHVGDDCFACADCAGYGVVGVGGHLLEVRGEDCFAVGGDGNAVVGLRSL